MRHDTLSTREVEDAKHALQTAQYIIREHASRNASFASYSGVFRTAGKDGSAARSTTIFSSLYELDI